MAFRRSDRIFQKLSRGSVRFGFCFDLSCNLLCIHVSYVLGLNLPKKMTQEIITHAQSSHLYIVCLLFSLVNMMALNGNCPFAWCNMRVVFFSQLVSWVGECSTKIIMRCKMEQVSVQKFAEAGQRKASWKIMALWGTVEDQQK